MLWVDRAEDHEMEWTEEAIDRLRAFWDEGLPTAEIGRRLGISKNAVVGKAHRLDLPARPSPIPTAESRQSGQPNRAERRRPARRASATSPASAATSPGSLPPPTAQRVITCSWPLGDPGKPDFHFCDATALPSKPYCAAHAERAYVRVRDKGEEAA